MNRASITRHVGLATSVDPTGATTASAMSAAGSAVIELGAQLLRDGALVAFPTETVYGLGAAAMQRDAVAAVFEGKGRPTTDPLILHVESAAAAAELTSEWSPAATALADRFWPGPLTLVLPRSTEVPDSVTAGRDNVALRVPAHPVALELLRAAGIPVAAPSANRFGRISPTTAAHVEAELSGVYDLLIDAGPTPLGVESSVVDLSGPTPRLLRPGGVTLEDLRHVLGEVDYEPRRSTPEEVDAVAPGQFVRHYSPATPLVLVEGADTLDRLQSALVGVGVDAAVLALPAGPADAAAALYATLRRADDEGCELLLVATASAEGLGRAVNDRLFRAASGRVAVDATPSTVQRLTRFVVR